MTTEIESIRKGIFDTKTVKAHYIHLAEGQKTNQTSVKEFERFAASPLFGAATVMIHGTALTREHFDQLAAVGGKLVWSPQSNLRLYDETTDIAAAMAAGVPVALGADWMPSGSPSLLHELKVAMQVIDQTPGMVRAGAGTGAHGHQRCSRDRRARGPARHVGGGSRRRPDDPAEARGDPYDTVVAAYPSWVDLVMIGGDIIYGRPDWVADLSTPATTNRSPRGAATCCSTPASAPRRTR